MINNFIYKLNSFIFKSLIPNDLKLVPDNPRISFCTSCKGRSHHLKETFIKNILTCNKFNNVEFILLNYDSPDDMEEWVKNEISLYIEQGLVKYYRTHNLPFFNMSHSKNITHKLASGDIVCNLDADNYLSTEYVEKVLDSFKNNAVITHAHIGTNYDCYGRISILKKLFVYLGGYDENMKGWGAEDRDLVRRVRMTGLKESIIGQANLYGSIPHTDAERTLYYQSDEKTKKQTHLENEKLLLQKKWYWQMIANKDRSWGKATIE